MVIFQVNLGYPVASWFSDSSNSYLERLQRTGQNSLYANGTSGCIPLTSLNNFKSSCDQWLCIGRHSWMTADSNNVVLYLLNMWMLQMCVNSLTMLMMRCTRIVILSWKLTPGDITVDTTTATMSQVQSRPSHGWSLSEMDFTILPMVLLLVRLSHIFFCYFFPVLVGWHDGSQLV